MVNNTDPRIENHGYVNQGNHKDDVNFKMHEAPPAYHQNSIRCSQCEEFTWRATPNCVHCGYDIKHYLLLQKIRRDISYANYRLDNLGKWIIGSIVVIVASIFLNLLWLTVVGFIVGCVLSEMSKKVENEKQQLKCRFNESSY